MKRSVGKLLGWFSLNATSPAQLLSRTGSNAKLLLSAEQVKRKEIHSHAVRSALEGAYFLTWEREQAAWT